LSTLGHQLTRQQSWLQVLYRLFEGLSILVAEKCRATALITTSLLRIRRL
jgi:hypothetical protein